MEVLIVGDGSPRVAALPAEGPSLVGRSDQAMVRLNHESVSREHAALHLSGGACEVEDLASKNGTSVDGRTLPSHQRTLLSPGSAIRIGDVSLVRCAGNWTPPPRTRGPETPSGESMRALHSVLTVAAPDRIPILILGETGVGKEVIAERVHELSGRSGPLVAVHCAAISETLFESEVFGHEKGAFTGAHTARAGLVEQADGGTLFIDELGELSSATQVKLLRVLEQQTVRRVGANTDRRVDLRLVAATNRPLEEEVAAGRFREDLYFRLSGFTVRVPPLRERRDEIVPLARTFLDELAVERGSTPQRMAEDFEQALLTYPFPGNVRELKHLVRRASLVASGDTVQADHLPQDDMRARLRMLSDAPPEVSELKVRLLKECGTPAEEREAIEAALARCGGNQTQAAELVGVSRRTLLNRLTKLGIPRPRKA